MQQTGTSYTVTTVSCPDVNRWIMEQMYSGWQGGSAEQVFFWWCFEMNEHDMDMYFPKHSKGTMSKINTYWNQFFNCLPPQKACQPAPAPSRAVACGVCTQGGKQMSSYTHTHIHTVADEQSIIQSRNHNYYETAGVNKKVTPALNICT